MAVCDRRAPAAAVTALVLVSALRLSNRDATIDERWRSSYEQSLSHFKSCYTHEELVEHFLLTPPTCNWYLPAAETLIAAAWRFC